MGINSVMEFQHGQVPFANGYRITQQFGENPDYYAQFHLAGHEGIDLVPSALDFNDTVYCVEDGTVIVDVDDATAGKDYGIYVVVMNRASQHRWYYCHLALNNVMNGQHLQRGDKIGKMGQTGNATGPHLHLGLRMTDAAGVTVNVNNGYQGFIDPLPVVQFMTALEQATLDRAIAAKPWMPVNNQAALWKFAQSKGLEDQQTDELSLTYNGVDYIVQVFNLGIVYAKKGDYAHINFIKK